MGQLFVDFVPYIHNTARVTQLPSPYRRQTPRRVSVLELESILSFPIDRLFISVNVVLIVVAVSPVVAVGAQRVEDFGEIDARMDVAESALREDLEK